MIKHIIFDLDDTLCDYRKARENAKSRINEVLNAHEIGTDVFWKRFNQVESVLFRQFANRDIGRDEYRIRRFADVLEDSHVRFREISSELNHIYMQETNDRIELFDDSILVMKALQAKEIETVILTNGPSDVQRAKYRRLGLSRYIQRIYISEEIGFSKPYREAFEYVLRDFDVPASEVLMVGDSIENDIVGAEQVGIKAVLIDRRNKHCGYDGTKIGTLAEVIELL